MEKVCAHLYIGGQVQGVLYRASARDEAKRRGLGGWARNLPDGRVEALAQGDRAAVEDFIRWCWKGPPAARVTDVQIEWQAPQENVRDFRIVF